MALNFPNTSRSYDATHEWVRFWGHDGTFEVAFFVDREALSKLQNKPQIDEISILSTIDRWRARILGVAAAVYRGRRRSTYRLVAADF